MISKINSPITFGKFIYSKNEVRTKKVIARDCFLPKACDVYFSGIKSINKYSDNEMAFIKFRQEFSTKLHTLEKENGEARWNFDINSTPENNSILNKKEQASIKLFEDEKTLIKLKEFESKGIKDPELKRHLDYFLCEFSKHVSFSDTEKVFKEESIKLAEMFNKLDDTEIKKNTYKQQLIKVIKLGNEFARQLGFDTYIDLKLKKEYNLNSQELGDIIKTLNDRLVNYNKLEYEKKLSLYNCLKKPTEATKNYFSDVNNFLPLAKSFLANMGLYLDDRRIKYDLFKSENKYPGVETIGVDVPKDVRVINNLDPTLISFCTGLLHELAHTISLTNISDSIHYLDKYYSSNVVEEAWGFLIESLPMKEPNFIQNTFNMPEQEAKELVEASASYYYRNISDMLNYINFENEIYKNPDQDLDKLWEKISGNDENPLYLQPHFANFPGYFNVYLCAHLMSRQIYEKLQEKFGVVSENKDVGNFMKNNHFKYGRRLKGEQILLNLTGEKLKPDAFLREMEKHLSKYGVMKT